MLNPLLPITLDMSPKVYGVQPLLKPLSNLLANVCSWPSWSSRQSLRAPCFCVCCFFFLPGPFCLISLDHYLQDSGQVTLPGELCWSPLTSGLHSPMAPGSWVILLALLTSNDRRVCLPFPPCPLRYLAGSCAFYTFSVYGTRWRWWWDVPVCIITFCSTLPHPTHPPFLTRAWLAGRC